MARYYFDYWDGQRCFSDEEGLELDGIESARNEARKALADAAKDVIPKSMLSEIAIEVRDETSRPLLRASLQFEVQPLTELS
jgi:hypothetical protein